jgi:hypothetical protein
MRDEIDATVPGRIVWAQTEQGAGPDVGMSIGLGNGTCLWCGEISRNLWEEAGEDAAALGSDFGWWLVLYTEDEAVVLGKLVGTEAAHALTDALHATITKAGAK